MLSINLAQIALSVLGSLGIVRVDPGDLAIWNDPQLTDSEKALVYAIGRVEGSAARDSVRALIDKNPGAIDAFVHGSLKDKLVALLQADPALSEDALVADIENGIPDEVKKLFPAINPDEMAALGLVIRYGLDQAVRKAYESITAAAATAAPQVEAVAAAPQVVEAAPLAAESETPAEAAEPAPSPVPEASADAPLPNVAPVVAPQISGFDPNSGAGVTVRINGSGFAGTTSVKFAGDMADRFDVVSDFEIEAVSPSTSTLNGKVEVANDAGSAVSADDYIFGMDGLGG